MQYFCAFKERHYKLKQRLIHQGFWYSELCRTFKKFSKHHADIITKYGCSVRRHIDEGICLPVIDAFLDRNVTIHIGNPNLLRFYGFVKM